MQDTPSAKDKVRAGRVEVETELVAEAEAAGLDVAAEIETALRRAIAAEARRKAWYEENRAAIEANNAELDRNGPWYEPDWLAP